MTEGRGQINGGAEGGQVQLQVRTESQASGLSLVVRHLCMRPAFLLSTNAFAPLLLLNSVFGKEYMYSLLYF